MKCALLYERRVSLRMLRLYGKRSTTAHAGKRRAYSESATGFTRQPRSLPEGRARKPAVAPRRSRIAKDARLKATIHAPRPFVEFEPLHCTDLYVELRERPIRCGRDRVARRAMQDRFAGIRPSHGIDDVAVKVRVKPLVVAVLVILEVGHRHAQSLRQPRELVARLCGRQHEARSLRAEHFERRYAADSHGNASVRDLDPLRGVGCNLVSDDGVPMCVRLGDEIVVSDLKKCVHSGWFVSARTCPCARRTEARHDGRVRPDKEGAHPRPRPRGEFVGAAKQLVADSLDAEHRPGAVGLVEPIPEAGAEVEAVVQVLRLDEHIGVEEIGHQSTPRRVASSWKVESFLKPSIWKASRWSVCPSRVLAMTARANRLLTRTG